MPAMTTSFPLWLGTLFGHSEFEVQRLLQDGIALQFLVAWSLFESKCFGGFVKAAEIERYARDTSKTIDSAALCALAEHFHVRYQNKKLFDNLMHQQKNARLSSLLNTPYKELTAEDRLFFLVFVVYRYRNNIFHGNKGVLSWLNYGEQIQYCVTALQLMVSHAEHITPTMNAEAA